MSDAETIFNTWSDAEITSGSETLSDAEMGDDERPSGRRGVSHKPNNISEQSGGSANSVEAAILTFSRAIKDGKLQTIEDAIVKRCMSRLQRCANHLKADSQCYSLRIDGLRTKHDDLQDRVSVLETAEYGLQRAVKRLLDEVKEVRDELKELRIESKELRGELSRKRMADATDGIDEIEEEAQKLKRRRVKNQEHGNGICTEVD